MKNTPESLKTFVSNLNDWIASDKVKIFVNNKVTIVPEDIETSNLLSLSISNMDNDGLSLCAVQEIIFLKKNNRREYSIAYSNIDKKYILLKVERYSD